MPSGIQELTTIPVFPLCGVILFPSCLLPLNIFEPRYLTMVNDTLETEDGLIGLIQRRSDNDDDDKVYNVGCAGTIFDSKRTEDGRIELVLRGVKRYRVLEIVNGPAPYPEASVDFSEFMDDDELEDEPEEFDFERFSAIASKFFGERGVEVNWDNVGSKGISNLINELSMFADLASEDKQALLEIRCLEERYHALEFLMMIDLHSGSKLTIQ